MTERKEKVYLSQSERDALAKAIAARLPERLLDIDDRAGKAHDGFYILGDLDATYALDDGFINRLHDLCWPVFRRETHMWQRDQGVKQGEPIEGLNQLLRALTDPGWRTTLGGKTLSGRRQRRESLGSCLSFQDDYEEALAFISKEENLAALEKAVNESIAEVQAKYGDPFAIKWVRRSLTRAIFNAVAERNKYVGWLRHRFQSQAEQDKAYAEFRLIRILKNELLPLMKHFNSLKGDQWVPGIEFQGRLEEQLQQRGWKLSYEDDRCRLRDQLWQLASMAEVKTTLPLRLMLQDGTSPPCPWQKGPRDFILAHVEDIGFAAVNGVAAELDKELASPEGVQLRHCSVAGREKKPGNNPGPG